jgi:2-C-methyl-D-erythritol 4-phosphate cytidylyltransferase
MGGGLKKEYRSLAGLPVLLRALIPFLSLPALSHIAITIPPGDDAYVNGLLETLCADDRRRLPGVSLVSGGSERRESVLRGLESLPHAPEAVLIHDGARPWVSEELILRVLEETLRSGAAIPVVPSTDAMKGIDEEGVIRSHLPRRLTVAAQTPQGFRYPEILAAHRHAAGDGEHYIDDSQIFGRYAGPVHTVSGDPANLKITYARDLAAREAEQSGGVR